MKLRVTREDIKKATRLRNRYPKAWGLEASGTVFRDNFDYCKACPISQAARRTTKKAIYTEGDVVSINETVYELPKEAQKFIKEWDNERPVRPMTFELKKLDEYEMELS